MLLSKPQPFAIKRYRSTPLLGNGLGKLSGQTAKLKQHHWLRSNQWRRERDSNPRYGFPYTHFPGVRLQPLGHPSDPHPRRGVDAIDRRRRRPASRAATYRDCVCERNLHSRRASRWRRQFVRLRPLLLRTLPGYIGAVLVPEPS